MAAISKSSSSRSSSSVSKPKSKPVSSAPKASQSKSSTKTSAPKDKASVAPSEKKDAAKQSNTLVDGLGKNFSAKKGEAPEANRKMSPAEIKKEQERFNELAKRVTPGSGQEGSIQRNANNTQELLGDIVKPEVKAKKNGSSLENRFNDHMERTKQEPRMSTTIQDNTFDTTISNPKANLSQKIWGGFTADQLK